MYLYQYVESYKVGAMTQWVIHWSAMLWNLVTAGFTIPENSNVKWVKSRHCRYNWVGNAFSFALLARAVAQWIVIQEVLDLNPTYNRTYPANFFIVNWIKSRHWRYVWVRNTFCCIVSLGSGAVDSVLDWEPNLISIFSSFS